MREIKYRLRLKARDTGEFLVMNVPLFDEGVGLMQYPVDLNEWEVLSIDEWTGLKDRNGKEIYEKDVMESETYGGERMEVRWREHWGYYLHSMNDNEDDHLNTEEMTMSVVVGNAFEHPHLLKGE